MRTVLELGSGANPIQASSPDEKVIHLDCVEGPHVELYCNLEHGIPLPSNTIDHVQADDVLEHITDTLAIMDEIHRVLAPNGTLLLRVPVWGSYNHITDPTHKHGFSSDSFDFFDDTTALGSNNGKLYTRRRWRIEYKEQRALNWVFKMRALKPGETKREIGF